MSIEVTNAGSMKPGKLALMPPAGGFGRGYGTIKPTAGPTAGSDRYGWPRSLGYAPERRRRRYRSAFEFMRRLSRHVVGPMFKGVECHNAHRVVELPGHQIGNDRFEVRLLDFGFAVNAPELSEAINYEVNGLVCTVGHNPWRPTAYRSGYNKVRPRRSHSEALQTEGVHPPDGLYGADTGTATASVNPCVQAAEQAGSFSERAPDQSPSRLRPPPPICCALGR